MSPRTSDPQHGEHTASAEDAPQNARREFLIGALSAVPVAAWAAGAAWVAGCAPQVDAASADAVGSPLEYQRERPQHRCWQRVDAARRSRWLRLVDAHVGRENLHDLPGIMQTFSPEGEMIINGLASLDPQSIAAGHVLFGMTAMPGALANTQVISEREYFTDDAVLVEGRIEADHVGDVLHFPATGRRVVLPYSAIYRFDDRDELISERIVMNWAPLAGA